jgi:phage tail sheath protein FI
MERALSKMAKYQIMEFNDNFTRNRIVSMVKPYLGSVQAGRGIQDFLVICDESNNTPDVISRNQLVVDIYIKPTYVAEFIQLRFTNAGTNSFAEVIGG